MTSATTAEVIVIGGGMAGLAAAWRAASENARVILLEKNSQLGRKILLSGSGQCNVTPALDLSLETLAESYLSGKRFVTPALRRWMPEDTAHFFRDAGLPLVPDAKGKLFPATRRAADVVRVLREACIASGVTIITNTTATEIKPVTSEQCWRVLTSDGRELMAHAVIIATGGKSYPQTGSTGGGYALAASVGHTIVAPRVALTPIIADNWALAEASGIAVSDAVCRVGSTSRSASRFSGDVLITHRGISGPAILRASRILSPGDTVLINFLGASHNAITADQHLVARFIEHGRKTLHRAIAACFPLAESLVRGILKETKGNADMRAAECPATLRRRIAELLTAFPCRVARLGGWNEAMVTAGGVATSEVNSRTLQSRLAPGLFFAGEVLDVDGDCGGFNLHWAMASGCLAGELGETT